MTPPSLLLSAANLLDIAQYTEHQIGCPSWFREHRFDDAATRDRRCDCGLDEQLEAVRVMAEGWRELLTEPGSLVCGARAVDGRVHVEMRNGSLTSFSARRLAAMLLLAAAEVDVRAAVWAEGEG